MDADEFAHATEPFRNELRAHCYRMLGSVHDADDLVQETMIRAWRASDRFDPQRATMRTWLYRIATNACLSALEQRRRRPLPSGVGPAFDDPDAPLFAALDVPWLQPMPTDPETSAIDRSRLRLALVAALQLLPPRQRAALLLREVLDLTAAEIADQLATTTAGANSALQRARAQLDARAIDLTAPIDSSDDQRALVERYVDAFERADVAMLRSLLSTDVVMEMPPMRNWYAGIDHYEGFMRRVYRLRGTGWTTTPLWANGQAGFAAYLDGGLHTVQILETSGGRITRTTDFQDDDVFALFALRR
jgi:RNA polymerase sigma-70 factor (ECF subfamily)